MHRASISRRSFPFIAKAFADMGFAGTAPASATSITVEIVRKPADQIGFAVHSRRWWSRSSLLGSPLQTPEDCALAYADLLEDVGAGRLTPEEAHTISAIVAKRAELFPSIELAVEIEALKAQLAAVIGAPRPPSPIRRPFAIT